MAQGVTTPECSQSKLLIFDQINKIQIFRGPELAPGKEVQTDEEIDAFVRKPTNDPENCRFKSTVRRHS